MMTMMRRTKMKIKMMEIIVKSSNELQKIRNSNTSFYILDLNRKLQDIESDINP